MREFSYELRVYFSDTDAEGIVYHARYLDFAEHARTEMLRAIGYNQSQMKENGVIFVVKSMEIEYKKPAFLDDVLTVVTAAEEIKKFSAVFSQTIRRGEDEICFIKLKVASLSSDAKRIVPVPEHIVEVLK